RASLETARFHLAARRHGGVAARGACATGVDAGDRISEWTIGSGVRSRSELANTDHTVAIFRQINKVAVCLLPGTEPAHHDALEFPDGEIVLLTRLCEGQKATVLTLPTQPQTAGEAETQRVA